MVRFAFRPVVAFQPNSPSCGNQPANISQTARRLDTPTKDKDATRKRTGPVSPHPAGRPAHPCPLDKPADISVTTRDTDPTTNPLVRTISQHPTPPDRQQRYNSGQIRSSDTTQVRVSGVSLDPVPLRTVL